jgi:hypothetical protein
MTTCANRIVFRVVGAASKAAVDNEAEPMKFLGTMRCSWPWSMAVLACSALLIETPAVAADKSVAACFLEIGGITAADEAANAVADGVEQAVDIGLPIMAPGILAGLNQVNANLASIEGPLTSIARSTCDLNDTMSNPANPLTFSGWVEGADTEPLPANLSTQIDGTAIASSPEARSADFENEASIKKMEANLKDGYFASHLENEAEGLAAVEGMAISGIAAEKIALAASDRNTLKMKAAGNAKEIAAVQMAQLQILTNAVVRMLIVMHHQNAVESTYHWNDMAPVTMSRDSHLMAAKALASPI